MSLPPQEESANKAEYQKIPTVSTELSQATLRTHITLNKYSPIDQYCSIGFIVSDRKRTPHIKFIF